MEVSQNKNNPKKKKCYVELESGKFIEMLQYFKISEDKQKSIIEEIGNEEKVIVEFEGDKLFVRINNNQNNKYSIENLDGVVSFIYNYEGFFENGGFAKILEEVYASNPQDTALNVLQLFDIAQQEIEELSKKVLYMKVIDGNNQINYYDYDGNVLFNLNLESLKLYLGNKEIKPKQDDAFNFLSILECYGKGIYKQSVYDTMLPLLGPKLDDEIYKKFYGDISASLKSIVQNTEKMDEQPYIIKFGKDELLIINNGIKLMIKEQKNIFLFTDAKESKEINNVNKDKLNGFINTVNQTYEKWKMEKQEKSEELKKKQDIKDENIDNDEEETVIMKQEQELSPEEKKYCSVYADITMGVTNVKFNLILQLLGLNKDKILKLNNLLQGKKIFCRTTTDQNCKEIDGVDFFIKEQDSNIENLTEDKTILSIQYGLENIEGDADEDNNLQYKLNIEDNIEEIRYQKADTSIEAVLQTLNGNEQKFKLLHHPFMELLIKNINFDKYEASGIFSEIAFEGTINVVDNDNFIGFYNSNNYLYFYINKQDGCVYNRSCQKIGESKTNVESLKNLRKFITENNLLNNNNKNEDNLKTFPIVNKSIFDDVKECEGDYNTIRWFIQTNQAIATYYKDNNGEIKYIHLFSTNKQNSLFIDTQTTDETGAFSVYRLYYDFLLHKDGKKYNVYTNSNKDILKGVPKKNGLKGLVDDIIFDEQIQTSISPDKKNRLLPVYEVGKIKIFGDIYPNIYEMDDKIIIETVDQIQLEHKGIIYNFSKPSFNDNPCKIVFSKDEYGNILGINEIKNTQIITQKKGDKKKNVFYIKSLNTSLKNGVRRVCWQYYQLIRKYLKQDKGTDIELYTDNIEQFFQPENVTKDFVTANNQEHILFDDIGLLLEPSYWINCDDGKIVEDNNNKNNLYTSKVLEQIGDEEDKDNLKEGLKCIFNNNKEEFFKKNANVFFGINKLQKKIQGTKLPLQIEWDHNKAQLIITRQFETKDKLGNVKKCERKLIFLPKNYNSLKNILDEIDRNISDVVSTNFEILDNAILYENNIDGLDDTATSTHLQIGDRINIEDFSLKWRRNTYIQPLALDIQYKICTQSENRNLRNKITIEHFEDSGGRLLRFNILDTRTCLEFYYVPSQKDDVVTIEKETKTSPELIVVNIKGEPNDEKMIKFNENGIYSIQEGEPGNETIFNADELNEIQQQFLFQNKMLRIKDGHKYFCGKSLNSITKILNQYKKIFGIDRFGLTINDNESYNDYNKYILLPCNNYAVYHENDNIFELTKGKGHKKEYCERAQAEPVKCNKTKGDMEESIRNNIEMPLIIAITKSDFKANALYEDAHFLHISINGKDDNLNKKLGFTNIEIIVDEECLTARITLSNKRTIDIYVNHSISLRNNSDFFGLQNKSNATKNIAKFTRDILKFMDEALKEKGECSNIFLSKLASYCTKLNKSNEEKITNNITNLIDFAHKTDKRIFLQKKVLKHNKKVLWNTYVDIDLQEGKIYYSFTTNDNKKLKVIFPIDNEKVLDELKKQNTTQDIYKLLECVYLDPNSVKTKFEQLFSAKEQYSFLLDITEDPCYYVDDYIDDAYRYKHYVDKDIKSLILKEKLNDEDVKTIGDLILKANNAYMIGDFKIVDDEEYCLADNGVDENKKNIIKQNKVGKYTITNEKDINIEIYGNPLINDLIHLCYERICRHNKERSEFFENVINTFMVLTIRDRKPKKYSIIDYYQGRKYDKQIYNNTLRFIEAYHLVSEGKGANTHYQTYMQRQIEKEINKRFSPNVGIYCKLTVEQCHYPPKFFHINVYDMHSKKKKYSFEYKYEDLEKMYKQLSNYDDKIEELNLLSYDTKVEKKERIEYPFSLLFNLCNCSLSDKTDGMDTINSFLVANDCHGKNVINIHKDNIAVYDDNWVYEFSPKLKLEISHRKDGEYRGDNRYIRNVEDETNLQKMHHLTNFQEMNYLLTVGILGYDDKKNKFYIQDYDRLKKYCEVLKDKKKLKKKLNEEDMMALIKDIKKQGEQQKIEAQYKILQKMQKIFQGNSKNNKYWRVNIDTRENIIDIYEYCLTNNKETRTIDKTRVYTLYFKTKIDYNSLDEMIKVDFDNGLSISNLKSFMIDCDVNRKSIEIEDGQQVNFYINDNIVDVIDTSNNQLVSSISPTFQIKQNQFIQYKETNSGFSHVKFDEPLSYEKRKIELLQHKLNMIAPKFAYVHYNQSKSKEYNQQLMIVTKDGQQIFAYFKPNVDICNSIFCDEDNLTIQNFSDISVSNHGKDIRFEAIDDECNDSIFSIRANDKNKYKRITDKKVSYISQLHNVKVEVGDQTKAGNQKKQNTNDKQKHKQEQFIEILDFVSQDSKEGLLKIKNEKGKIDSIKIENEVAKKIGNYPLSLSDKNLMNLIINNKDVHGNELNDRKFDVNDFKKAYLCTEMKERGYELDTQTEDITNLLCFKKTTTDGKEIKILISADNAKFNDIDHIDFKSDSKFFLNGVYNQHNYNGVKRDLFNKRYNNDLYNLAKKINADNKASNTQIKKIQKNLQNKLKSLGYPKSIYQNATFDGYHMKITTPNNKIYSFYCSDQLDYIDVSNDISINNFGYKDFTNPLKKTNEALNKDMTSASIKLLPYKRNNDISFGVSFDLNHFDKDKEIGPERFYIDYNNNVIHFSSISDKYDKILIYKVLKSLNIIDDYKINDYKQMFDVLSYIYGDRCVTGVYPMSDGLTLETYHQYIACKFLLDKIIKEDKNLYEGKINMDYDDNHPSILFNNINDHCEYTLSYNTLEDMLQSLLNYDKNSFKNITKNVRVKKNNGDIYRIDLQCKSIKFFDPKDIVNSDKRTHFYKNSDCTDEIQLQKSDILQFNCNCDINIEESIKKIFKKEIQEQFKFECHFYNEKQYVDIKRYDESTNTELIATYDANSFMNKIFNDKDLKYGKNGVFQLENFSELKIVQYTGNKKDGCNIIFHVNEEDNTSGHRVKFDKNNRIIDMQNISSFITANYKCFTSGYAKDFIENEKNKCLFNKIFYLLSQNILYDHTLEDITYDIKKQKDNYILEIYVSYYAGNKKLFYSYEYDLSKVNNLDDFVKQLPDYIKKMADGMNDSYFKQCIYDFNEANKENKLKIDISYQKNNDDSYSIEIKKNGKKALKGKICKLPKVYGTGEDTTMVFDIVESEINGQKIYLQNLEINSQPSVGKIYLPCNLECEDYFITNYGIKVQNGVVISGGKIEDKKFETKFPKIHINNIDKDFAISVKQMSNEMFGCLNDKSNKNDETFKDKNKNIHNVNQSKFNISKQNEQFNTYGENINQIANQQANNYFDNNNDISKQSLNDDNADNTTNNNNVSSNNNQENMNNNSIIDNQINTDNYDYNQAFINNDLNGSQIDNNQQMPNENTQYDNIEQHDPEDNISEQQDGEQKSDNSNVEEVKEKQYHYKPEYHTYETQPQENNEQPNKKKSKKRIHDESKVLFVPKQNDIKYSNDNQNINHKIKNIKNSKDIYNKQNIDLNSDNKIDNKNVVKQNDIDLNKIKSNDINNNDNKSIDTTKDDNQQITKEQTNQQTEDELQQKDEENKDNSTWSKSEIIICVALFVCTFIGGIIFILVKLFVLDKKKEEPESGEEQSEEQSEEQNLDNTKDVTPDGVETPQSKDGNEDGMATPMQQNQNSQNTIQNNTLKPINKDTNINVNNTYLNNSNQI